MSQPLGEWVGHTAEVAESLAALEGRGAEDLMTVTLELAVAAANLVGVELTRERLLDAIASGAARERFDLWAAAQGASAGWLKQPDLTLAPSVAVVRAPRSGVLAGVDTHRLGVLFAQLSGADGRSGGIDFGVALRRAKRLGEPVGAGEVLLEVLTRQEDATIAACFTVADRGEAPPVVVS